MPFLLSQLSSEGMSYLANKILEPNFFKKTSFYNKGNNSQKELKMLPSDAALNQNILFCVLKGFKESDFILCKSFMLRMFLRI